MTTPYIIENGPGGQEKVYDIYSRMLKDRVIFIKGVFNESLADSVTAQLLFLETTDPEKDIWLYINSPGGSVSSMYSIFDTMNYIKPDVCTLVYGEASSAASFILAAGTPGKRYALPNADIMIHELSSGFGGKFHDVKVDFKKSERLYEKMVDHYVKFTGKDRSVIKKDMERDFYMSAEDAKEYGIIDAVQIKRGA